MITSCNHSSTEKLCGSCREKNYRQSFLDEKDARIAELERQLNNAYEATATCNGELIYTKAAAEYAKEQLAELREAARGLLNCTDKDCGPSVTLPDDEYDKACMTFVRSRAVVRRILEGK